MRKVFLVLSLVMVGSASLAAQSQVPTVPSTPTKTLDRAGIAMAQRDVANFQNQLANLQQYANQIVQQRDAAQKKLDQMITDGNATCGKDQQLDAGTISCVAKPATPAAAASSTTTPTPSTTPPAAPAAAPKK